MNHGGWGTKSWDPLYTHCFPLEVSIDDRLFAWRIRGKCSLQHTTSRPPAHRLWCFGGFKHFWTGLGQSLYNMSPRTEFRANSAQKRQISVEGPGDAVTGRIQRKQVTVAVYSICLPIVYIYIILYIYNIIYIFNIYIFNIYIYIFNIYIYLIYIYIDEKHTFPSCAACNSVHICLQYVKWTHSQEWT